MRWKIRKFLQDSYTEIEQKLVVSNVRTQVNQVKEGNQEKRVRKIPEQTRDILNSDLGGKQGRNKKPNLTEIVTDLKEKK